MPKLINPNLRALYRAYSNGIRGVVMEGSSRCFHKDQLIETNNNPVKIAELSVGDTVLSFNHNTNQIEEKRVIAISKQQNTKKCFRIKMKDGTIIKCTDDHNFFFDNQYVELKKIVSLIKK